MSQPAKRKQRTQQSIPGSSEFLERTTKPLIIDAPISEPALTQKTQQAHDRHSWFSAQPIEEMPAPPTDPKDFFMFPGSKSPSLCTPGCGQNPAIAARVVSKGLEGTNNGLQLYPPAERPSDPNPLPEHMPGDAGTNTKSPRLRHSLPSQYYDVMAGERYFRDQKHMEQLKRPTVPKEASVCLAPATDVDKKVSTMLKIVERNRETKANNEHESSDEGSFVTIDISDRHSNESTRGVHVVDGQGEGRKQKWFRRW